MSAAIEPVPHDNDIPAPPCPKLWINVLASSLSDLSTNPDGRCGRRPIVVRMTRSHDALTIGNRRGVLGATRGVVATVFGAQPSSANPIAAMPPNCRRLRRFIAPQ